MNFWAIEKHRIKDLRMLEWPRLFTEIQRVGLLFFFFVSYFYNSLFYLFFSCAGFIVVQELWQDGTTIHPWWCASLSHVASLVADQWLQSMWVSAAGAWELSSCSTWAQLPPSIGNPPRSETELASPALAGGLSTFGPPGKPTIVLEVNEITHLC